MPNRIYDDQDTTHDIDMSGFEESFNGSSAHGTGPNRQTGSGEPQGERDTRPDLRSQEGLKGSGAHDLAKQSKDAEKAAELAYLAGAMIPSKDLRESEEAPSFYKSDKNIKGKGKGGFWNKKRAGIFGALTGGGIAGLVTLSTLVSGPLEFIHMAQIFHSAGFSHQESAGDSRMSKMYRYLREGGSAGETRLGWIESKYHANILGDLKEVGLTPEYGTADIYQGFSVDTTNKAYDGMTPEEVAQSFQDKYGITPTIDGDTLHVSATGFFDQKIAVRAMLQEQGLSGVAVAARARVMAKFGLVPGAFHPMRYVDQKIFDTAGKFADFMKNLVQNGEDPAQVDTTGAEDQTGTDKNGNPITQNEGVPDPDTSSSSKISDILGSIKSSKSLKITGGIAMAIGLVCAARTVDDNIGAIRYIQVVIPLIRIGMLAMTMGYQIESGQDVPLSDMNNMAAYLNQVNGKGDITSNWSDNAAVRSQMGLSGGSDPLSQNGTKDLLAQGQPSWLSWTQNSVVATLCSTFGQIASGVVSVVVGIFSDGIASTATGFIVSALAAPLVIGKLSHILAGQAIDTAGHGAIFGEEGIYGAKLAGNNSAVHLGAAQLTTAQSNQLSMEQEQTDKQAFDSESFFARVFNIDDYQSLTGRLADSMLTTSLSGNMMNSLATVTDSFSNVMKMPFNIFSSIASADTPQAYDYPFPEYDFSQADLNNTAVGDPYANANDVATILDQCSDNGTDEGDCSYIQKAESCFGDQITKDNPDHVWDVIPDNDVDPYDATNYNAASCADSGNMTWLRIRFFILDTGVMEGYACSQFNDPTSCSNDDESNQATTAAPSQSSLPSGTAQQLANLIAESPNVTFQTPQEKTDFDQIVQTGKQTACGGSTVSTTLLGTLLTVSDQYQLVLGGFDDGHPCSSSDYNKGTGVDIEGITPLDDTTPGTGNSINWNDQEQTLLAEFYTYTSGLLSNNGGGRMGERQCFTSTAAPPAPSGVTFFNDTCDHVQLDVGST